VIGCPPHCSRNVRFTQRGVRAREQPAPSASSYPEWVLRVGLKISGPGTFVPARMMSFDYTFVANLQL
jgi:hypothetical protein